MYRAIGLLMLVCMGPASACSLDEVVGQIYFSALTRAGELSNQQLALLEKFSAIGDRAKDPNKPLNQQLSQADLAEFTQTKTRYQSIELLQLLESNYSRDNRTISEFFTVAQEDYLGMPAPKEGDKRYLPYAFLAVMAAASEAESVKNNLITEPSRKDCSVETALQEVEQESLDRLNKLPLGQAAQELNAMRARNGGAKVDRDKLGPADRTIFDRIQRTAYAPAYREKAFITNLESLKLLARTAVLKFELGKKDAIDSGGDFDAVGKSVDALNLDERGKFGFGILAKIAEKYPSDWFKQKEKVAPVIDAIKKQDAARMSKKQ
jgi:hypothetical protein